MNDSNNGNRDQRHGNGNGDGRDDDQGHGGHSKTTIIVNTREKEIEGKVITYDQIVALAFENPPSGENIEITIAYRDGHGPDKEGTLKPGETVRIKKDMIFDVTATDKS
jgi:Multiubiquitin